VEDIQAISMSSEEKQKSIVKIVGDYGKRLFGFIRKKVKSDEEANDILQDVWYQLSNFIYTDSITQINAWLFTVARNKITDSYRKKKPDLVDDFSYEDDEGELHYKEIMLSDDPSPEAVQLKEVFWSELFEALDELPEKQKEVFVLNELEEMTLQQIADKNGENIKTIISRKGYAVKHLRNRLQSLYDEFMNI
jgi:RNA polymerase sigma factor (sigma-70 family)